MKSWNRRHKADGGQAKACGLVARQSHSRRHKAGGEMWVNLSPSPPQPSPKYFAAASWMFEARNSEVFGGEGAKMRAFKTYTLGYLPHGRITFLPMAAAQAEFLVTYPENAA